MIHSLIKYKVTPISLAESLDEIMIREEENEQFRDIRFYTRKGSRDFREKKSRFIAHIAPAQTEEEAQDFVEKIKETILGCQT